MKTKIILKFIGILMLSSGLGANSYAQETKTAEYLDTKVTKKYKIVIPIFDGVTQLDFTGPYQMLSLWAGADLVLASVGGKDVKTAGITFTDLAVLEKIDSCDILLVPGGKNTSDVVQNDMFIKAIHQLGKKAEYITSVCTGSILLGAAGLIEGKQVASHWAWRDILSEYGAIPNADRFVRDGNVLSGGGVTAGIDFGLQLIAELDSREVAEGIQLYIEYNPNPPFNSGTPETASSRVLEMVENDNKTFIPQRKAILKTQAKKSTYLKK